MLLVSGRRTKFILKAVLFSFLLLLSSVVFKLKMLVAENPNKVQETSCLPE